MTYDTMAAKVEATCGGHEHPARRRILGKCLSRYTGRQELVPVLGESTFWQLPGPDDGMSGPRQRPFRLVTGTFSPSHDAVRVPFVTETSIMSS